MYVYRAWRSVPTYVCTEHGEVCTCKCAHEHYLGWSHFIPVIHWDQVLFSHGVSHVKGDPGHKGGTVEQVLVEAVVLGEALLVVGPTGPLPFGPYCIQWDAGWGAQHSWDRGESRRPGPSSGRLAHLCEDALPVLLPRWREAPG